MSRRLVLAALGALTLAPAVAAHAQASTTQASTQSLSTESDNPINDQGSNYDYRSVITGVAPNVPGLHIEVLEFADRLLLTNHTGQTVTVYGYAGEPYARVTPAGTVQINTISPAYYLNQNFYADVTVPASASSTAAPRWTVVDRTDQLEWHDHRIHWMSPVPPPQVKDKGKRTKIFDWRVPIEVGSRKGFIDGELFWTPENSKTPIAAIVALVVIVLAAALLVLVVRRRRRPRAPGGGAAAPDAPVGEAW